MKVWRTAPDSGPAARDLALKTGLPLAAARILVARGWTDPDEIERFFRPRLSDFEDPFLLPDMEVATRRILRAIGDREPIAVFGDYDVDGITATALLTGTLRALGATVFPFLPHREEDGYGLSPSTLDRCLDIHHPTLLITVDCGTGSVAAVCRARERGVDVIVTDHHEP
ncbi:MAG: DHH family phosphoesterase, partial [Kiritimatiellia bacterium]|nr:DHH family phosphoesterase [Kiritimatiellia bacterium]